MLDRAADSLTFTTLFGLLAVTGLRVSSVSREADLQAGRLSPPPDAQTLYWQHAEARP